MMDLRFLALTLVASGAYAGEFQQTTKTSCLILPPVNESLIINHKTGDQTEPGERDQYVYDYSYKNRADIILSKENKEGQIVHSPMTVEENKSRHFKAKKVEHVENLAKNFIESKKFHQCE